MDGLNWGFMRILQGMVDKEYGIIVTDGCRAVDEKHLLFDYHDNSLLSWDDYIY